MKSIKTRDYSVSQEFFTLEYDEEYHLYKTTPLPENLDKYYESEDYISHTDASVSLIDKLYQTVKKIALATKTKLVVKYANEDPKVLDIGCGTGSFVQFLNSNKINAYGIEPSNNARGLAIKKGVSCFKDFNELKDKDFDIITMWHVLEHVPNFNTQLKSIKNALNENGKLIVAVPNFESYDAKYYDKFWAAYDVPRHIWHFSEKAIGKIAQENGFILKKVKPMWFDSFYVSMLSEKYKNRKLNFIKAFSIGLISNLKAITNGQFSSKIYILEQKS